MNSTYSGGPLFCYFSTRKSYKLRGPLENKGSSCLVLHCMIFRFWNYKIRGTYYAFRIQIPKFWDSRYIICTLNLQNTKNENTNFQFLFPTNPLNPKRPHEDVFGLSLLKWRFPHNKSFWWKHLNDRWTFLYQLVLIRRS